MRVFFDLLRKRVGSPLSLASMARDLAVAPGTLRRYLDVLLALYIVFVVQPWHRSIARALLRFAGQSAQAQAVQLVRDLRQPGFRNGMHIEAAADWLVRLAA